MHGRVLFPTYRDFKQFIGLIDGIAEFIVGLEDYNGPRIELRAGV
jgi:hypothetical protein